MKHIIKDKNFTVSLCQIIDTWISKSYYVWWYEKEEDICEDCLNIYLLEGGKINHISTDKLYFLDSEYLIL